jgi:hypothetical protein
VRLVAAAALLSSALLLGGTAHAQALSAETVVSRAVARACQGNAGGTLTRDRLAEALVVEARVAPTLGEMASIAEEVARTGTSARVNSTYIKALRSLQEALASPRSAENGAIVVTPAAPPLPAGAPDWIFGTGHTLACAPEEAPSVPQFTELRPVVIRGSVDALDDLGDDRRAAAAAQIGWERTRVTDLEGATTRTETLTVDATAGLAFGNVDRFAVVYADYSRNRVETRKDGEDRKVDEVDALELGVLGTVNFANLRTTGRVGVTLDEVTGARYLRGNLHLRPVTGGLPNLGLCNLNSFRTIARGIRGRCVVEAEVELRDVLRRGNADIGDTDILAALGGTAGIEFGPGFDPDGNIGDGIVASARYTYLAVVEGALPDIDRFEASLAYRWWMGDVGFDVGLTYSDGTERKSFSDENRFGFRIGLIY